jgi:hypothetical protein
MNRLASSMHLFFCIVNRDLNWNNWVGFLTQLVTYKLNLYMQVLVILGVYLSFMD